jgi:ABC-type Mn2+/Zn2+ transport system ATPase subunit
MLKATNSKLILGNSLKSSRVLLSNINLNMEKAKLHYLYGPNGIGKTSLVKAILGIEFKIDSIDKSFKSFFYLPQVQNKEYLYPCLLSDISKEGNFLSSSERFVKWNKASGGQKKKALLERAFRTDCDLYVFDEPYNHLDQSSINELNLQLEKIVRKGKSVIMIGHKEPIVDKNLLITWNVSSWK